MKLELVTTERLRLRLQYRRNNYSNRKTMHQCRRQIDVCGNRRRFTLSISKANFDKWFWIAADRRNNRYGHHRHSTTTTTTTTTNVKNLSDAITTVEGARYKIHQ